MSTPVLPVGLDSIGASFYYAAIATSPEWIEIENIISITPCSPSQKAVDVTCINDGDRVMRSIPGMVDPGTVVVESLYDYTAYDTLFGISGTLNYWKVVMPDGLNFQFSGFIMKNELSQLSTGDKAVTIKTEIKIAAPIGSTDPS